MSDASGGDDGAAGDEAADDGRSQREKLLASRGDKKWAPLPSRQTEVSLAPDGMLCTALPHIVSCLRPLPHALPERMPRKGEVAASSLLTRLHRSPSGAHEHNIQALSSSPTRLAKKLRASKNLEARRARRERRERGRKERKMAARTAAGCLSSNSTARSWRAGTRSAARRTAARSRRSSSRRNRRAGTTTRGTIGS